MSDLKICRICLQLSAKMYKSKQYQLRSYYEEIMDLKVNEKDGLPQRFCYECAALLYKFHKFKEKCYNGHRILKDSLCKGATQSRGKTDADGDTFCERCDIKFETRQAYEEHLFHSAMHSKGVEDLVEDIPASACPKVRRKGMRTPRKPTTCSYCGKIFPTQSACMKHHHADHARTPFCPTDERHICEICGLSLAPVSVAHHLNTHTRERLFTCNTCGVQFNTKSSMNRHQLTHAGEKPFACSLCDKRFTQSNSVKLHYRTFHLKQPYPKRTIS